MINWFYNLLYYSNPCYKSIFGYSYKFWEGVASNLDVVNLGSNTGLYGFRYDGLPVKAANWALGPQSLNQDLMILKTYSSYIRPRGTVLVPLGPYSSCLKSYTGPEWLKYYTIVPPEVMEDYDYNEMERAFMFRDHPFKVEPRHMLRGVYDGVIWRIRGWRDPLTLDFQPMTEAQIENHAYRMIEGWLRQFKIDDMESPLPQHILDGRKKRVATLREMRVFCDERGYKMHIVLPPVTRALSKHFSPIFRENYIYSFLREAGIDDSRFHDYLDDAEMSNPALYVNSMFLNSKGGSAFTNRVLSDISLI